MHGGEDERRRLIGQLESLESVLEAMISRRAVLAGTALGVGVAAIGLSAPLVAHADNSWGGYSNGQIPVAALSPIPWASGYRLRADAVTALVAMNTAYQASFGHNFGIEDGYRDYAGQVAARDYWCSQGNCGFAAEPGTSNHGWALAVDFSIPRTDWSNPTYLWLKANAAAYGWAHPNWAEPSGSYPEAWHWEYTGNYQEDDLPTIADIFNTPVTKQPNGADVTLAQALTEIWRLGNMNYDETPGRVWGHTLAHTVATQPNGSPTQTPAGDLLRYESAEHKSTRDVAASDLAEILNVLSSMQTQLNALQAKVNAL